MFVDQCSGDGLNTGTPLAAKGLGHMKSCKRLECLPRTIVQAMDGPTRPRVWPLFPHDRQCQDAFVQVGCSAAAPPMIMVVTCQLLLLFVIHDASKVVLLQDGYLSTLMPTSTWQQLDGALSDNCHFRHEWFR